MREKNNLVLYKYEIWGMRMNEKENDRGQLEKGTDVTAH